MKCYNIAFFASHNGSNMQSIIEQIKAGILCSKAALIISNNSNSGAAEKAGRYGIPFYHISSKTHLDENERTAFISELYDEFDISLTVLAGYMKKFPPELIRKANGMVLNIHPALLPKFGGEGMFGMNVHKAVIQSGEQFSGATVHLVDSEYDRGRILLQESLEVSPDDTPESLARRVLEIEHRIYPALIKMLELESIKIPMPVSTV
ncbi:MAG: phosphoribosylglycinamide formyltransferase [Candidatus Kapaibacterium sp.]|jgi:phosphoribosylglycinamide formyltransferase-1|nr:phosphoribosylglycinamide formyltransferase [Candidatus Kapabacteria bacterium]